MRPDDEPAEFESGEEAVAAAGSADDPNNAAPVAKAVLEKSLRVIIEVEVYLHDRAKIYLPDHLHSELNFARSGGGGINRPGPSDWIAIRIEHSFVVGWRIKV